MAGISCELERNRLALDYLDRAFTSWTVDWQEGETEYRSIQGRKDAKSSVNWIQKAKRLCPTDERVVERMNELGEFINNHLRYKWGGTFMVPLWCSVFFITFILGDVDHSFFPQLYDARPLIRALLILGGTLFLVLAHFVPAWLIYSGKNTSFSALRAISGTAVELSQSTAVWRHSNGTTSRSSGGSGALLLLLIGFVVDLIIFPFRTVYAFFRNYVFC